MKEGADLEYGATLTADEVLDGCDLRGKRILVTGVSSGIGVETARVLAGHGAAVVGTARDLIKGAAATKSIRSECDMELIELDLSSLSSVRTCADTLLAAGRPFDAIIANAGVMAVPFELTHLIQRSEVRFEI